MNNNWWSNMGFDTPLFFGLVVVSGFGGALVTMIFYSVFWKLMKIVHHHKKIKTEQSKAEDESEDKGKAVTELGDESLPEFLFTGVLVGIVERVFFTFAILALGNNGILQSAIGWVAIKGQVHFKMFTDKGSNDVPRAYLGMLGSLVSLAFAILGAYLWRRGYFLTISPSNVLGCFPRINK